MIYLTGDTHCTIDIDKLYEFSKSHTTLTKKDFVIILGDAGITFSNKTAKGMIGLYSSFPFTILFVDGNHENFHSLNKYAIHYFHGGKVHKLSNSVYHLLRGQIFLFDGLKILTMGGADSTDKIFREENKTWWKEERIDYKDIDEAMKNVFRYHFNVDYVLTHCLPTSISRVLQVDDTPSQQLLEGMKQNLTFKKWYCGHYHIDRTIGDYQILYNDFVRIL